MKIPFLVLCAIILILEILGSLGRSRIANYGASAFVLSAIVQIIVSWFTIVFFFYTGMKVLKLTNGSTESTRMKRLSRVITNHISDYW